MYPPDCILAPRPQQLGLAARRAALACTTNFQGPMHQCNFHFSFQEGEPSELVLGLLGPGKRGYGFGLGKRDRQFGFGLGKRGQQYGFGLGKRAGSYEFGLGKREGSFGFGLGKRDYGFGLGKRDGQQFGFGLGKRDF